MGAFFNQTGYEGHVRAVARLTSISPSAASKALAELAGEGILESREVGRNRLYRLADPAIARSAQDLYAKTAGIEGLIQRELQGLSGAEGVYLIGSYAAGTQRRGSDIDVLVVGNPDREDLEARIIAIEAKVRREVNPSTLSLEEFQHPVSGFARTVRQRPMVALKAVGEDR